MKHTLLLLSLCASALLSSAAIACNKPGDKPEIPDAATVVTAQMVKANNEMKAYVKAVEDYITCARLSKSEERREYDDLKKFADDFNQVVRSFKARSAG